MRVEIEKTLNKIDKCQATILLFLRFLRLRALRGDRRSLDDFRKGVVGKVFFTRLLICVVLARIFLQRLQLVSLPAVCVDIRVEELTGLLSRVEHLLWWQAKHLHDSCNLIVFACSREQW